MGKHSFIQRLKDVSITKKLYFAVGTMAILIAVELFTLWFAVHTLSSVRAFVSAEGLWSKAQKDAIYYLSKYYRTYQESDYRKFTEFMAVPLGDHKTRMELLKLSPNLDIARQGFLEGRIHPDDIDGMIKLFRRFHSISYINKAITIWGKGDSIISRLMPLGEELHQEISSPRPSDDRLDSIMDRIEPINQQLTKLEDDFSYTLGEGSRWLENLVLKLLFAVALTVEITGLLITISVSRSITKGLDEINRATKKIANGDLSERAKVFSQDEIGQVAVAMNQMTEQLIHSNKELGQFAYIASHDLQEPLRSISNYVSLFQKNYTGKLDENGDKYLSSIMRSTSRMQLLIKDMLDYSRIGHDNKKITIDCRDLVEDVLRDLEGMIRESGAIVKTSSLPVIVGYSELKLVFQNLVSNAIKFAGAGRKPVIEIMSENKTEEWVFSVKDNGIGIEEIYYDRIFVIFQRLHTQKEYSGTGIGLAHCKKIVEMHGGKIWVESVAGKGSSFYFSVPKSTISI
jgi:two-component system, sensor histidine kinase